MSKTGNHVNIYEGVFTEPNKLDIKQLLAIVNKEISTGKQATINNGTFYIKEFQENQYSYIFLFGKDNPDASNLKREKSRLAFQKLDIDTKKEVLSDCIHVGISKSPTSTRKGKQVHTIMMEKSSLFKYTSLKNYFDYIIGENLKDGNSFLLEINRKVVKDYLEEIEGSKRILEIVETSKDIPPPLPDEDQDSMYEDIEVKHEIIYKPNKRGGSIPIGAFKSRFNNYKKRIDKNDSLHVKIRNSDNNEIEIDFDKIESSYGVKYDIPINRKDESIQEDISSDIDNLMKLVKNGEL